VLLRVCDETARDQLHEMMSAAMAPGVRCWELGSDGEWTRSGDRDHQAERLREIGEAAG
jgi:polyphosphate kinase